MARFGVLIVNLGTPDAPKTAPVRRYLREFLSDPRVIDIPALFRYLLLYLVILPFRPQKSAEAYRKVWGKDGSPLLAHSRDFIAKIEKRFSSETHAFELAMRYQRPSIEQALSRLQQRGVSHITVMPMFPQYSSAAYGSAVERIMAVIARDWNVIPVSIVPPFYQHPGYIEPMAKIATETLREKKIEKYLFSFHGVPERQCIKSEIPPETKLCCVSPDCCEQIVDSNRFCYRAQCFATAKALAKSMNLSKESWEICFQSRLGRTPWIRPYTDERLTELANQGIKHIAVFCPSFVTDCLETTEEIGMRALEDFVAVGGKNLWLIPGLNSDDAWVDGAATILNQYLPG